MESMKSIWIEVSTPWNRWNRFQSKFRLHGIDEIDLNRSFDSTESMELVWRKFGLHRAVEVSVLTFFLSEKYLKQLHIKLIFIALNKNVLSVMCIKHETETIRKMFSKWNRNHEILSEKFSPKHFSLSLTFFLTQLVRICETFKSLKNV